MSENCLTVQSHQRGLHRPTLRALGPETSLDICRIDCRDTDHASWVATVATARDFAMWSTNRHHPTSAAAAVILPVLVRVLGCNSRREVPKADNRFVDPMH